ncbi:hypothetical protein BC830DRAFT_1076595 [Chytriomyces sp. MP71]|nr:hypothetical protein BC830DRAFT_1076595 [Chytriomyces sp. MP71]
MALNPLLKPLMNVDALLKPNEATYVVDVGGRLSIDCAPFDVVERKLASWRMKRGSVDRLEGNLAYFATGQEAAFNKLAKVQRVILVDSLLSHYNPQLADAGLDCALSGKDDTAVNEELKAFEISRTCLLTDSELDNVFANQKTNSLKQKGDDRRAWLKPAFKRFIAKYCLGCLVLGITHLELDVAGDRIWDADGWYRDSDAAILGVRINDAKFAIPAFCSKESLNAFQVKDNISLDFQPLRVLVMVVRPYLEKFIEFQRRKISENGEQDME